MLALSRPRLHDHVQFHVPVDPTAGNVVCMANGVSFLLGRAAHRTLVPLLDGQHTLSQLIAAAAPALTAPETIAVLQWLIRHDAVCEGPGAAPRRVAVRATGNADATHLVAAFERKGLTISNSHDADIDVIVADNYLHPDVAAHNAAAARAWMLVRPDANLWLGPIIVPGKSACWCCLAQRLRFNFRIDQYLLALTGSLPTGQSVDSAAGRALCELAAHSAAEFLRKGRSPLVDGIVKLDASTLEARRHPIVRRPQCEHCGAAPRLPDRIPDLSVGDDWKHRRDRDAAARATLEAYAYHISPITGLVPELTKQSKLGDIHVYGGGSYNVREPTDWQILEKSLNYRGSGKGLTADVARAGAFAETLEWYTLVSQDPRPLLMESHASLSRRVRTLTPIELTHFSAGQYADREAINLGADSGKQRIPEPFDSEVAFGWTRIWSLTRSEWVHVPGAAVSYSYECPFMRHNPNGSAAGPTLAEAVVHGAFEAVERDAIALWWYNYAPCRQADLSGVDAGLLAAMHREYGRIGRRFWVLDITSDLGIPVAAAISIGDEENDGELVMGFGAHFDPRVAATRALTELNQLQHKLVDTVPREDRPANAPGSGALPPHIFPVEDGPVRPQWAPLDLAAASPVEQIAWLQGNFERAGMEMLVCDLTLPDVHLPVAKVIVPQLRHAFPQLGPGRLHDVPLRHGWIDAAVDEARMRALPSPL